MKRVNPTVISQILTLLAVITTYLLLSIYINSSVLSNSGTPYFNLLTEAFLRGRLDVTSSGYDLTSFNGKDYLYWGPSPVLFIIPFYSLGLGKDILYTLIAGLLNVMLFSLILRQAARFFNLQLSNFGWAFLLLSFALASPNLYLSLGGRVWHTSQVIAIFYLLLSLLFYFKFLNRGRIVFLSLSTLFFCLAWMARISLILYGLLLLYPLYRLYKQHKLRPGLLAVGSIIGLFVIIFALYNYARFSSFTETGLRYQSANGRFVDQLRQGKELSLSYLPYNLKYYFLNSPLLVNPLSINIDPEGNSVFLVYPVLLTLPFLITLSRPNKKESAFLLLAGLTALGTALLLLSFLGTGWTQFGNRYFFDCIPILSLLSMLVIKQVPNSLKAALLIWGIFINFYGAIYFFSHF